MRKIEESPRGRDGLNGVQRSASELRSRAQPACQNHCPALGAVAGD